MTEAGKVYLVGAGPGDPKLITLRGLECLQNAEVIVYDRLVDERLLAQAKADAELIYMGKAAGHHAQSQDGINRLLIAKAKEGKVVVRLKGGDPFVFGRGGEELEALAAEGVPFEVVPGATSAVAVPAYAGIPVTHRGLASSFTVVTGHEDPTKGESRVEWDRLPLGTVVVLMGANNLEQIATELLRSGRNPDTPVAFIHRGTTPHQKTVCGRLADIVDRVRDSGLSAPAVIVVGEVVGLRDKLRWFDRGPLFGRRVLVTRSREQAGVLSARLAQEGAEPIELPTIDVQPLPNYSLLYQAIERLGSYAWVVFTSVNGVRFFWERLYQRGGDGRSLKSARLAAIGPATAAALESHGLRADYQPEEYLSEAIAAGLGQITGQRVLLPRAEGAREVLPGQLAQLGALVEEVPVYRISVPEASRARARQLLTQRQVDIATFTSSSTVRNLVELLGGEIRLLEGVTIACIGPVTAATAEELGLKVDITAREHTIEGLVRALRDAFLGRAER